MGETAATAKGGCEQHTIAAEDGLGLAALDYAPTAPASGLPVICLHGLIRNARDFSRLAPGIAARGRRVICPDLRGRGRSDWDEKLENYAPRIYVRDTLKVLDTLGVGRAVFIGTSLGGIITMLLALKAKDRIAAAVLNDVGPVMDNTALGDTTGRTWPATFPDMEAAVAAWKTPAFPDRDEAGWREHVGRATRPLPDGTLGVDYDPKVLQTLTESKAVDMTPLFEALAAQGPVLLVRGELSGLVTDEGVARMRAVDPDMALVDVPRVGHAPSLEEPQAWNGVMDFLSKAP